MVEFIIFLDWKCGYSFKLCRIWTKTVCAREMCSYVSLRRGRLVPFHRFLFLLFEFFTSFADSKPYCKKHTGVLQVDVSGWQIQCATWQFSPTMAATMQWAWIWNPSVNMGLIPTALVWITDFSVSACVSKEQSPEQSVPFQPLVFCVWWEAGLFSIPIPTPPTSCSNHLLFLDICLSLSAL